MMCDKESRRLIVHIHIWIESKMKLLDKKRELQLGASKEESVSSGLS